MGCDIHIYAEVLKDGHWQKVGKVFDDPYHRQDQPVGEPDEDGYVINDPKTDEPYEGRNYHLFALLANVRNNGGVTSISEPRGLPADVSDEVKAKRDDWGEDGHSHSWFSLTELESFDWKGGEHFYSGWVTPHEYLNWKKTGRPKSWCASVGGGGVKHVSNDKLDLLIASEQVSTDAGPFADTYTRVSWIETSAGSAGEQWFETMKNLKKLGPPDKVRVVFWFDN